MLDPRRHSLALLHSPSPARSLTLVEGYVHSLTHSRTHKVLLLLFALFFFFLYLFLFFILSFFLSPYAGSFSVIASLTVFCLLSHIPRSTKYPNKPFLPLLSSCKSLFKSSHENKDTLDCLISAPLSAPRITVTFSFPCRTISSTLNNTSSNWTKYTQANSSNSKSNHLLQ